MHLISRPWSATPSNSDRRPPLPRWLWPLLPAVLGGLVYLNAIPNGFALDDVPLVEHNREIESLSAIPGLFVQPYWPGDAAAGLYRPVTIASLALNRGLYFRESEILDAVIDAVLAESPR